MAVGGRSSAHLWRKCGGIERTRRDLCGQDPQRGEASRPADAAAGNFRAGHQSQSRQSARPYRAVFTARPRRRGDPMRRRDFITLLGGAFSWSLGARAADRSSRLGILDVNTSEYSARYLAAFRDGLRRLGYIDGRNVQIDYRAADGDTPRLPMLAQELVQLKPDVVLAVSVSPVMAVKSITPALPIVCPSFGDAFVPSLARSFAHPGGNVTGIASN